MDIRSRDFLNCFFKFLSTIAASNLGGLWVWKHQEQCLSRCRLKPSLFLPQFCRVKTELFEYCDFSVLSMDSERAPWTRWVLFSIAIQFPKLDVAGSIPVSRSSFQRFTDLPFSGILQTKNQDLCRRHGIMKPTRQEPRSTRFRNVDLPERTENRHECHGMYGGRLDEIVFNS